MAMSELKRRLLKYELAQAGFPEAVYSPVKDRVNVQADNERMPEINDAGDIHYGTEYSNIAINTIRPIVDRVNESFAAWERSEPVPFEDLKQYRVLAEYNNIMLAARDDTELGRGLYFVTWRCNNDRTGLGHGNYTASYAVAKEDFAVRAGLMPSEKIFTQEQADAIQSCVDFRLCNGEDLTYSAEETLRQISEQLLIGYNLDTITATEIAGIAVENKELADAMHGSHNVQLEETRSQQGRAKNQKPSIEDRLSAAREKVDAQSKSKTPGDKKRNDPAIE